MLRDAALLQLELLLAALEENVVLKDGSPYNVQWRGTRPVFVDVGSFEALREGEAWAGYRQFCMLFLYPLLLQAYRGVPFNAWLRGSLDGIAPEEMRRLLSARDVLRPGVLTHVRLLSALERRGARERNLRAELRDAGFRSELVRATVRRLQRLVERLDVPLGSSVWTDYGPTTTYHDADAERKAAFVRGAAAARRRRRLVWDLGCGNGQYARVAAEHADYTVALDSDAAVVERLFRSLRDEGSTSILPLVANLADPPPALGWRQRERVPLEERGPPDLVLCLALVHHLAISANVPLAEIVRWLRGLGAELVVELVTPEDPMAQRLLERKREGLHADYDRATFERLLGDAFTIERTEELASGARVLYQCRP